MENKLVEKKNSTIFCKISFDSGDRWFGGIITYLNIDKGFIEIFLSVEQYNEVFQVFDEILISCLISGRQFLFKGRIDRRVISLRRQAVTIKISDVGSYFNNRTHERYKVNFSALIKPENILNEDDFIENIEGAQATINDISVGGISLFSEAKLCQSQKVHIEIIVNARDKVSFFGEIIHKSKIRDGYNYGVRLEVFDDEDTEIFDNLLKRLANQSNSIRREYESAKMIRCILYSVPIVIILVLVVIYKLYFFYTH